MRLEYMITAAFVLDLLVGDPRWFPHPVKFIGRLAKLIESPLRNSVSNTRVAGVLAVVIILGITGSAAYGLITLAGIFSPVAADIVSIIILYTTFATRDLARHSHDVYTALRDNNLPEARRRVSLIVGRDTENLNEAEVTRGAVESVAENLVDGVTAPIFYAVIGGPVGAIIYKAINTLDSTFGYKNEQYILFGWASARLDDVANFLPARITAPLISVGAALLGLRPVNAFKMFLRDGRKHPSPNSGLSEAAVAGALGIQLGGLNYYFGQPSMRQVMGDPINPIDRKSIIRANALMLVTAAIAALLFTTVRIFVTRATSV